MSAPVMLSGSASSVPLSVSSLLPARMREDMAQQHNHRFRIRMSLNKYRQTDTQSVSPLVSEAVRGDSVCAAVAAAGTGPLDSPVKSSGRAGGVG